MERSRPAATADSAGSGHGGSRWRLDHRRGMSEGEVVFERACVRDERNVRGWAVLDSYSICNASVRSDHVYVVRPSWLTHA
jgi:hypothetical protein